MKTFYSLLIASPLLLATIGCDSTVAADPKPGSGKADIIGEDVASEGEACGAMRGVGVIACDEGLVCDFDEDSHCGGDDTPGTCRSVEQLCDEASGTVCGCDGQTYADACEAALAGADVSAQGACTAAVGETCGTIRGLGTITCGADLFCDFPELSMCGGNDQPGTCRSVEEACETDASGISCGCDGVTYHSGCDAALAGVDTATAGPCEG